MHVEGCVAVVLVKDQHSRSVAILHQVTKAFKITIKLFPEASVRLKADLIFTFIKVIVKLNAQWAAWNGLERPFPFPYSSA